jgi:hypothetical protein
VARLRRLPAGTTRSTVEHAQHLTVTGPTTATTSRSIRNTLHLYRGLGMCRARSLDLSPSVHPSRRYGEPPADGAHPSDPHAYGIDQRALIPYLWGVEDHPSTWTPPCVPTILKQRQHAKTKELTIIRVEMHPDHWDEILHWRGAVGVVRLNPRRVFGVPVVLLDTVKEPVVVAV